MQASQRTEYNHALEYAIIEANKSNKPLLVYFGIDTSFPEANRRHYQFMLEGLQEVKKSLYNRGIKMIIESVPPDKDILKFAEYASLLVVDRGYLKIERTWRNNVSQQIDCPLIQVESNVIVPVEVASSKEEYAAYTIRKKTIP